MTTDTQEMYELMRDLKQKMNAALKKFDSRIEKVQQETPPEIVRLVLTGRSTIK